MYKFRSALIALGALVLAVAAFYAFVLWPFSMDPLCSDEVLGEKTSPDGHVKATVDDVDCGATTDHSYHVVVHGEDRMFGFKEGESSTVFVGNQDRGKADSIPKLDWTGSRELLILYPKNMKVFKAEKFANGVRITYSSP